ncbi:MAG: class I SAM-dependent methyltransferase, partial [Planctomycetota bacterium]
MDSQQPTSSNPPLLISPEYLAEQQEFHTLRPDYGSFGHRNAPLIVDLIQQIEGCESVLDYGCGKGTLGNKLGELMGDKLPPLCEYDPCIPERAERPPACDLVVCTDVLEHIEP